MRKSYISLAVAVVLIIAGLLVYNNWSQIAGLTIKLGEMTDSKNELTTIPRSKITHFTHSTGAFSFDYPSDLISVTEQLYSAADAERYRQAGLEEVGVLMSNVPVGKNVSSSENNSASPSLLQKVAGIAVIYHPDFTKNFSGNSSDGFAPSIENTVIDGNKTYIVSYAKYPTYGRQYYISLEAGENPSFFLVGSLSPNTAGFTQGQFDDLMKSVTVNRQKLAEITANALKLIRAKALEASIKATLGSIRPAAELYYDNGTSYLGLCKPVANSQAQVQSVNLLKKSFEDLTKNFGAAGIACFATESAYAVSVKMPAGNPWCIDSLGTFKEVPNMAKTTSCR